jgi:glycosyltransferase involved in cell wall biosynthesis
LISPEVSVLIPFRDAAKFMDEAVESMTSQSFDNIEILLVNDSSSDGSAGIAQKWSDADPRIRVVNCRGTGLVDALNTGLRSCRGEWVARMDADDVSMPNRIEAQLEAAEAGGEKQVVGCMVKSFPEDKVREGFRNYERWLNSLTEPDDIRRNIFVESPLPHPTAFFHRVRIMTEGGYLERDLPEDYELWLRLWSRGYSFRRVPEVLLMWRERPERFSRISANYSLTRFYKLKARYLKYVPCMRSRRVLIAGGGQAARRLGKCLQEEGFRIEAFVAPGSGGKRRRLRGRPVIPPEEIQRGSSIPLVIATRRPGAREEIRKYLQDRGMEEWKDFVACT